MFFPSRSNNGLASVAGSVEKLAALQNEFEIVKKRMDEEAKKAIKLERKIKVLTHGYQSRAAKLWSQIEATYKQMDTAATELERFKALQKQEMLAAYYRIKGLVEEVNKQEALVQTLQHEYDNLVADHDRFRRLLADHKERKRMREEIAARSRELEEIAAKNRAVEEEITAKNDAMDAQMTDDKSDLDSGYGEVEMSSEDPVPLVPSSQSAVETVPEKDVFSTADTILCDHNPTGNSGANFGGDVLYAAIDENVVVDDKTSAAPAQVQDHILPVSMVNPGVIQEDNTSVVRDAVGSSDGKDDNAMHADVGVTNILVVQHDENITGASASDSDFQTSGNVHDQNGVAYPGLEISDSGKKVNDNSLAEDSYGSLAAESLDGDTHSNSLEQGAGPPNDGTV